MPFRRAGIARAEKWTVQRQEATGDWGGIIPAMLNAMLALRALGYDAHDPVVVRGWSAIDGFTIVDDDSYRVQPCISPVWDTGLAVRSLVDAGVPRDDKRLVEAVSWLLDKQIVAMLRRLGGEEPHRQARRLGVRVRERLVSRRRRYRGRRDGARLRSNIPMRQRVRASLARASQWVETMQCKTGGWGAFDIDNDQAWLNRIPYGDLKAMIDPSTADVTARVLEMAIRCKLTGFDRLRFEDGLTYLLDEQEIDGAWFGRWGVNYVYGTSGALAALGPARVDRRIDHAVVRGAVWLRSVQNADGGWGETTDTYKHPALRGQGPSTASQTAWALIGLLESVQRLPSLTPEFEPARSNAASTSSCARSAPTATGTNPNSPAPASRCTST